MPTISARRKRRRNLKVATDVLAGELMEIPEPSELAIDACGPCADKCDWCGAGAEWEVGSFGFRGRLKAYIRCSTWPKCRWTMAKTRPKHMGVREHPGVRQIKINGDQP